MLFHGTSEFQNIINGKIITDDKITANFDGKKLFIETDLNDQKNKYKFTKENLEKLLQYPNSNLPLHKII